MTIYPVLVEPGDNIRKYAEALNSSSFDDIKSFFKQQAASYGRDLERPLVFQVAQPLVKQPPPVPAESSGLGVAVWSLKMRWWAWRHGREKGLAPADIKIFVRYQNQKPDALLESFGDLPDVVRRLIG